MTLAAVLLAGGQSRRMGRDKALLSLDGQPLWQRQLDLLRAIPAAPLFVSAPQWPEWLGAEATFVTDAVPGHGPLSGLAATFAAMPGTHLLALPVDMPAMTMEHLQELWGTASPGCGVQPVLDGLPAPLPAIYPAEAGEIAMKMLAGNDVSLKFLARTLTGSGLMKPHPVRAPDTRLYANCNTPAEWELLQ